MKISREEFKEYVGLYQEAWNKFEKYADIIDSDFLSQVMFPTLGWLEKKLGLYDENIGYNMTEFVSSAFGDNYSPFLDDNGEMTKDLDVIYDKYVTGKD